MSDQQTPFGRVLGIQLRLALDRGWRGRAIGFTLVLVQLVAVVLFGVILGVSIDRDGVSFTQVVDFAAIFEVPITPVGAALLICFAALVIIAWFGPFKLWEGEPPSGRDYHWSMPVDKGRHDLARVLAGAVLLLGWGAALYGSVALLALIRGTAAALAGFGPLVWLGLFLGPLLAYLLTSFFTVRMERPSGWIWSILGLIAAITTLSQLLPLAPVVKLLEGLLFRRWGLASAIAGPVGSIFERPVGAPASWPLTWLLWLALLSAALVWGATDRRRIP